MNKLTKIFLRLTIPPILFAILHLNFTFYIFETIALLAGSFEAECIWVGHIENVFGSVQ